MGIRTLLAAEKGQMTVEFVIAFPVMIIVAVVAVNALLFFGECAAFDRVARESVRAHATSPAYGQGSAQVLSEIKSELDDAFDGDGMSTEVSAEGVSRGFTRYTATLRCEPTLFGHGFGGSVFGVRLAPLSHEAFLVVDTYKPGVVA